MNFWDGSFATSSPGTATPPPQVSGQPPPSLNEEVTEVFGQLERFWGGFRKQGQTAIQFARKDLGDYVSQAQKGLNKQLSTTFSAAPTSDTDAQSSTASSSHDIVDLTTADNESLASSSTSASTATLADPQQQQQRQRPDQVQSSNAQTLFTRLQSTIPPDLLTSLRETIPDSVRDAQARRELAQVAQARVQGAAARGEELLRGASVFLRDAVRVVPPEEAAFLLSSEAHEGTAEPRGQATPPPVGVASTPATRRGALLRSLREYPSILRVDPAKEERSAALFASWVEAVGAEATRDESHREAELGAEDGMLRGTHSALVPGELTEDEFWTRYFFRVHQIDQEEERRKAVLAAGPADQDDDFSWEDEDEDAAPKAEAPLPTLTVPAPNRDKLLAATDASGMMSPQRSDDSFDLVSSGHTSAAGDANAVHINEEGTSDDDEDEEDEDENEDEDEDEDEDEEGSDWE